VPDSRLRREAAISTLDRFLGKDAPDPRILLAKVDAVIESKPDFADYTPTSIPHLKWLGRAHSVVQQHDSYAAIDVKSASSQLDLGSRDGNVGQILGTLFRTRASLEDAIPTNANQVFGPGARYDFLKAFREIAASAKTTIMIVDPYVDGNIFDAYISAVAANVNVRILSGMHRTFDQIKPAAEAFVMQHSIVLAIRKAARQQIYDRLVFLDDEVCWVLGQSIKDAASASRPTLPHCHPTSRN
jgi:hypothetical protein